MLPERWHQRRPRLSGQTCADQPRRTYPCRRGSHLEGEAKKDLYESNDYDKTIIANERTELVAKAILENINRSKRRSSSV